MEYRFAMMTDLPLLGTWNRELIQDEGHRNSMSEAQLVDRMQSWLAKEEYKAVIFMKDNEPVAYVLFRENDTEVYLRQFFVARTQRRAGTGKAAFALLRSAIWPKNKRLTVEVLCLNAVALQFWRAMGYTDYALTLEILAGK
jgi:predicted acetyltransferase